MKKKTLAIAALSCLLTPACYRYSPPKIAAPVKEVPVSAPFDRTWQAVIDVFAQSQIPIRTIDKSSGLVVAEKLRFNLRNFSTSIGGPLFSLRQTGEYVYADCGTFGNQKDSPTFAIFNAQVKQVGDSSSLRINLIYEWTPPPAVGGLGTSRSSIAAAEQKSCVSTGKWEEELIYRILWRVK